jgi:branched-chain amino acid transport system substrate-binding protein
MQSKARARLAILGSLVLALVVALTISACGSSSSSSGSSSESTSSEESETTTSTGGEKEESSGGSESELGKLLGITGGPEAGEGEELNYGMLLAVTGTGSFYGKVMSQGAELGAEKITEAGGPGFNISIGDHESGLIPPGVSATRELTSQDGDSVLATSFGGVSEAIAPIVAQGKVLTYNGGGASPGQLEKPYLWMTRMVYGDASAAGSLAWMAKAFPEDKKLAILGTKENGLNATENLVPEWWPEVQEGGTITGTQYFEVGTTDFGSVVAKVKAQNPDIIYSTSFGNDSGNLIKALRQNGVDVPVMLVEYTPETCEIGGSSFTNVYAGGDFFDTENPNPFTQWYVKEYEAKYNEEPEFYGANYFEMTTLTWELMNQVREEGGDPTSGEDLNSALEKDAEEGKEFKSLYGGAKGEVGTVSFEPKLHTIEKPMAIYKTDKCEPEQVAVIKQVAEGEDPSTGLVEEVK